MTPQNLILDQVLALAEKGRGAEASVLVHRRAAQNDPEALAALAEMRWRGGLVPQDLPQARDLYRQAGDAGHAPSAALHTNLLANGLAGPRDWGTALDRLKREARVDPSRRQTLALVEKMRLTADGDPAVIPKGESLSEVPSVTKFPHLFSAAECDYLRHIADPMYQPSVVNLNGRVVQDTIRTSDGAGLHWLIEDPAVHALNRRLATASNTSFDHAEALLILRYRPGQQYRPHLDAVGDDNERVVTALVYLNHDYTGGETVFTKTGLTVKGRKGDAIVFKNIGADGRPDSMSEHAGLPITGGTKFLASRWIRARRWLP